MSAETHTIGSALEEIEGRLNEAGYRLWQTLRSGDLVGYFRARCAVERAEGELRVLHSSSPTPAPLPVVGEWKCPYCRTLQPQDRWACSNCGATRLSEADRASFERAWIKATRGGSDMRGEN